MDSDVAWLASRMHDISIHYKHFFIYVYACINHPSNLKTTVTVWTSECLFAPPKLLKSTLLKLGSGANAFGLGQMCAEVLIL